MATSTRLSLRQVRSAIGATRRQRDTLKALGLGRIGQASERQHSPAIDGMLVSVGHLVVYQEVSGE